jgi:uncharacterized tellurite resistance protein B-like protein
MSVADLYSSGFKLRNRDHFAAIVRVALSDDVITEEEQAFINRLAIFLEIDQEVYDAILENPEDYPINPPSSTEKRLERLYDLTRMVYADEVADAAEKKLLHRMVLGLGFQNDTADAVVEKALQLVADGCDEEGFIAALHT